ncbi:3,4-dihydroxy-2-butanone-4-phosphate synthase [Rickettsiales bacterium]|nr:3,4-dihydroxy-2-butanone-4-phosphate synthase [Rickettsiales bacterium]
MTYKKYLSKIEDIIDDAFHGRMFILVDDESRENEGDLVIPAEMADAKAINFMAKYGRGLICLPLTSDRIRQLGLPPMAQHNSCRHQTAFTVSIEAREGVTTGISAADRATTIAVAINEQKSAQNIVSPGHVFPLEARDGGVLVRAGHTEAAVDISRMAGLKPAGVICEIMNDDGTMARLPDLVKFAKEHDLKIATIADLIAYRRKHEKLVERTLTTKLSSRYGGEFDMHVYINKIEYAEHVALVKGDIGGKSPTMVRMHVLDVMSDVLGDNNKYQDSVLQRSMQMISENGSGVVVLLREPNRHSLSEIVKLHLGDNSGSSNRLRDYGIGAQILLDLGVRDMNLLTNSPRPVVGLDGYGLSIKSTISVK